MVNGAASQNRIIAIAATGYNTVADCKATMVAPNVAAFPTAIVHVKDADQILVSYSSSTAGNDFIYAYDLDPVTSAISGGTIAYSNPGVIKGASSMTYKNGFLYVGLGSTALQNSIEKFAYDSATKTLSRIGTTPFSPPTIFHKCLGSMRVH